MGVEILIYIYLAVALSVILFNIATIIVSKRRNVINEKYRKKYSELVTEELERINNGQPADHKNIVYLKRKLRYSEHLLVFIEVMNKQYETSAEAVGIFFSRISDVMKSITAYYERPSDPIRYAFFLYSIKEFDKMSGSTQPEIAEILMKALHMQNTYCRENALQAVYSSGSAELVIRALQLIDSEKIPHNSKLLCDGLLKFQGSTNELLDRLWEVFDDFDEPMQIVILDYVRFSSSSYKDKIFTIMTDENRSPELRFPCVRYFAKYPDPRAYPVLLEMVSDPQNWRWEFSAIACTTLANYPGEQTVTALKNALSDTNWYVRYNAAESLSRLGVSYDDMLDVLSGSDLYAKDIMQFQFDMQYNRQKEEASL